MKYQNVRSSILLPAATVILLAGALLSACSGPGDETASSPEQDASGQETPGVLMGNPLAGTEWRLAEIQSMDDSIGTKSPDDPSLYTMSLMADGTVSMRLNCNRANGEWSVQPSSDPSNGNFTFGTLAATQALCPQPSMDERIVSDSAYIRGYMLRNGRLYLSLMADGGIYAWEPIPKTVPYQTEPDKAIESAILKAESDYTADIVDTTGAATGKARYVYSRGDLNQDGREEVFVYMLGSIFCGTGGCNLLLFERGPDGYTLLNNFPITRLPVIVSQDRTNGWRNIYRPESGGGAPPSYVKHTFDGRKYIEKERMPASETPVGTQYLAGEPEFNDGIILEPRR